ncbi:MAG: polysaccharide export protein [Candidatus Krumholzibacteria bacterium]|nr:polysaccharide export protein [Candidatus Krumholzibacteria bacterium]
MRPDLYRIVAYTVLVCLVALGGCSTTIGRSDPERGVYAADDLPQFVEDTSALPAVVVEPEYVIGVGDKMDVVFLFHTNLTTRELVVRRDGRISLPYIGDQMAAGITPMTLDSLLTVRFSEILREPNVAVIIRQPADQNVYVLGEVERPGGYSFESELSIVQSIAMAGGLKEGASGEHAVLIRRQGLNRIVGVEIDVKGIMVGASLGNDVRLRNYDVVYVPQRPLYSAADFMQAVWEIVQPPLDAVFTGWQIANLSSSYEFFRRTTAQE